MVFGPHNPQFNQDTYQVPIIWQAINLIYSDSNRQIHIFIISGKATFGIKETIRNSTT